MPIKLHFSCPQEERAVTWFKRSYGRKWLQRALEEVAYDPFHSSTDWSRPGRFGFCMQEIKRETWVRWSARPYGAPDLNRLHQWARICIRRNVYFPKTKQAASLKRKAA